MRQRESELQVELKSAFDRLRLEPPLRIGRGRVIAVVGAGGGSGASTLAVNLAAIIGQQHRRCALLDLNLEGGDKVAAAVVIPPEETEGEGRFEWT